MKGIDFIPYLILALGLG